MPSRIQQSTPCLRFYPRPAEPPTTASEVEAPFPPPRCHPNNLWVWIKRAWMNTWKDITPPSQSCLNLNIGLSPGFNLRRNLWVTSNRLRTGVGRFGSNMCQWGLRETGSCGEENQTAHHIIHHCKALRPPNFLDDLMSPGPEGVCWLGRLVGIAWWSLLIRKKNETIASCLLILRWMYLVNAKF